MNSASENFWNRTDFYQKFMLRKHFIFCAVLQGQVLNLKLQMATLLDSE